MSIGLNALSGVRGFLTDITEDYLGDYSESLNALSGVRGFLTEIVRSLRRGDGAAS